jgi:hypothetical protein
MNIEQDLITKITNAIIAMDVINNITVIRS